MQRKPSASVERRVARPARSVGVAGRRDVRAGSSLAGVERRAVRAGAALAHADSLAGPVAALFDQEE
ncbi:MAG: hypothetical protein GY719_37870 [bacterium]|nr:hypothetical protein [bacterium]